MAKKILIAGGAGFIASHLSDRLWQEGFDLISVDNFVTGNLENIRHLIGKPRFQQIDHDITEKFRATIPSSIDYVLNFASPASPPDYHRLPIETLKVGSMGTYNLLELAREKSATFMMASTSEIYGDPQISPQPESYWGHVNPIGPRSVYDEAKRFSEALTVAYHRKHRLDIRLLRIFNTYGPRMRLEDGRAVPNFIAQALRGDAITVYGSGTQTRSFCYVDDEVDGIFKLLCSDLQEPVNIGNPEEISILELAKTICNLIGSKSSIIFEALPENDPLQRCPDISLAREKLNWEPKTPLSEGLRKTIEYLRLKI